MSSQLLIETFTYGNVGLFLKDNKINFDDEDLVQKIVLSIKNSVKEENRDLHSIWSIIWNIMINMDINSINYFKFIKTVFDILDTKFESDYTKVEFDNILTMKCYILNDISYVIDAYSISSFPVKDEILKYYSTVFKTDLEYITSFGIITRYNLPGENNWIPEWIINYNYTTIKTSNIDIYLEHLISNPCIYYPSNMNDVLEKMVTRLTFLKSHAKLYYEFLEQYIPNFSLNIFLNYPYYEVAKHYEKLLGLFDNVYIPENVQKEDFKGLGIIFSVIPESLSSYILGFPSISMGSLSQKLVNKFTKDMIKDTKGYFEDLEEKNQGIIKSKMFLDKCANGYESLNITNLLYNNVKSYNIDDVKTIMSNGVYFVFTYPEYDNLKNTEVNPYNREKIPLNFISHIRSYTYDKTNILSICGMRGLQLKLDGTMEQNFDELIKNIEIFKPNFYERDQDDNRSNLINTVLNSLLTGNFEI